MEHQLVVPSEGVMEQRRPAQFGWMGVAARGWHGAGREGEKKKKKGERRVGQMDGGAEGLK